MIIQIQNLGKTYQRNSQTVHALKGVNLEIARGEFVSIMGPSGSGKSSLLQIVGGLDRPSEGSVSFEGLSIHHLSDAKLSAFRRRKLGFVFQFFNLLPSLTALENIALPLLLDGQPITAVQAKAQKLLDDMGLPRRGGHKPSELSGGEMQRVAIARALITDPLLILADEPTGNLDSKTGKLVLNLLRDLARDRKQTVMMVTHDRSAADYGTRLIELRDGHIANDQAVIEGAERGLSV
jgi:putative ABC transport system ATP-binding protein